VTQVQTLEGTGLEVMDVRTDASFITRRLHSHDITKQTEGLRRLTTAFVESPETILQELVTAAIDLCGADSAGISVVKDDATADEYYEWVATAGVYEGFIHAMLPVYPSACGVTLERGGAQRFTVTQKFFDILGVVAPEVKDGLLLPWRVDETRGTIFIMAHDREEAFDAEDLQLMQVLADFAAMAMRHQRQQKRLLEDAQTAAAASAVAKLANELAHQINNPLQSVTNVVYLASTSDGGEDARSLADNLMEPVQRLTRLVAKMLALPIDKSRVE
jgi:GAF domain